MYSKSFLKFKALGFSDSSFHDKMPNSDDVLVCWDIYILNSHIQASFRILSICGAYEEIEVHVVIVDQFDRDIVKDD